MCGLWHLKVKFVCITFNRRQDFAPAEVQSLYLLHQILDVQSYSCLLLVCEVHVASLYKMPFKLLGCVLCAEVRQGRQGEFNTRDARRIPPADRLMPVSSTEPVVHTPVDVDYRTIRRRRQKICNHDRQVQVGCGRLIRLSSMGARCISNDHPRPHPARHSLGKHYSSIILILV